MQVVEALFDSHHTHVHVRQEVDHILCILAEKGVYDSLALHRQGEDNHTGCLEGKAFEETHHGKEVDPEEEDVNGNPAVVSDQLREAHNGGDAGVN